MANGNAAPNRTTQHIGAAGELLVQYQLLKLGIDSARLTTDSGIDLVAFDSATGEALTVQVKTMDRATPSGGTGRKSIGWSFPDNTRAQILAFAHLEEDRVWLFTSAEARQIAQQHSVTNTRRLYWYTDLSTPQKNGAPLIETDMNSFLLTTRAPRLFMRESDPTCN